MSGGSPNRPALSAFGPFPKENAIPVKNPKQQLDAASFNLMTWQVAGASQVMPKAWFLLDGTGGALAGTNGLVAHAEAWNPSRSLSSPTAAYIAVGRYSLTFASTYPDDSGNAINTVLTAAVPIALAPNGQASGSIVRNKAVASINGLVVNIDLRASVADTLADGPLILFLW